MISRRQGCFYTTETETNIYGIQMTHVDTRNATEYSLAHLGL